MVNRTASCLLCVSLLLCACSDPKGGETGGSTATAAAGSGGSTGGGGGAMSTGGGGAMNTTGGASGSTGTSLQPGDSVTIEMASFIVAPGQEVYKCQNFANPF